MTTVATWHGSSNASFSGLCSKPLDATATEEKIFLLYHPSGSHGHQWWCFAITYKTKPF